MRIYVSVNAYLVFCSEHPILNTQCMSVKASGHYIHVLYTLLPPPCDMTEYKLETLLETRPIVSELTHTLPYTVHLNKFNQLLSVITARAQLIVITLEACSSNMYTTVKLYHIA